MCVALRNRLGERAIEAVLHAIGIHGREQYLACAKLLAASRPFHRVDAFIVASAAGVDVPLAGAVPPGVDRQHHCLRAEFAAQLGDQLRTPHRGRVDRDFVCARHQDAAGVGDGANSAAYRQRDEDFARGARDDIRHDFARIAGGRYVEEDQFVGAVAIVAVGQFHGIARIAQVDEIDALYDAAAGDIQTRNDPFGD